MKAVRVHVVLMILIVCGLPGTGRRFGQPVWGAQAVPATTEPGSDSAADTELRLYKTALLESKNDRAASDAAALLLLSKNPAAREIVLDVLRRTDNPQARLAVCEALNPRLWQKPLKDKEDFIKPLIGVLTSEENFTIAKAAAEATLLFDYSEVQQDLEKAVTHASLPINLRMNVIYALRRHPDKRAVAELISLLDSPEPQIVEAARTALVYIGISVSPDPAARRQMLVELRGRSVEAFLRDRLIQQETRARELEQDRDGWQKRYLTSLSRLYDSLTDQAAKNTFMVEQLQAAETPVRSWALDKLDELRNANAQMKLSPELESILLNLVSDSSRQVRQKTARLLARMGELNAAKPLLEQLKVEQDDQVRREMLVALGEACYVGSLATAGRKVPDEVRRATLEVAVKFLNEPDAEKTRTGAGVIGKLLEQDGFKPEDVDRYLKALADRYVQAGLGADPAMRGYLLSAMASLCTTRSTCRERAAKLYGGLFEQALADKAEAVRLSAVDGLVNIDKPSALRKLRENLVSDSSVPIRQKLVDLAAEVGGPQDLDWLSERLGMAPEGDPAWQAMLKIFGSNRSDLGVLETWLGRIESLAAAGKVAVDQRIAFLTLVEQRAQSENKADLLKRVRMSLAQLYTDTGNFKQAVDKLTILAASAGTGPEKMWVQPLLLRAYLGSSSIDRASELIGKCLQDKDLDLSSNGFLVQAVEQYLNNPTTTNPTALLEALRQIQVKDAETLRTWHTLLSRWSEPFAKAKKVEDSNRINN